MEKCLLVDTILVYLLNLDKMCDFIESRSILGKYTGLNSVVH